MEEFDDDVEEGYDLDDVAEISGAFADWINFEGYRRRPMIDLGWTDKFGISYTTDELFEKFFARYNPA